MPIQIFTFLPKLINKQHMARAMYEYTKTILNKVSFDVSLFYKEVEKALQILLPYEIEDLKAFIENLVIRKPELKQCLILLKQ